MAFKKYTEKDKSLCKELQENRVEQDKLQQRLNELKEHERKLEEERQNRSDTQQTAEMVRISIHSGPINLAINIRIVSALTDIIIISVNDTMFNNYYNIACRYS